MTTKVSIFILVPDAPDTYVTTLYVPYGGVIAKHMEIIKLSGARYMVISREIEYFEDGTQAITLFVNPA